jgi:hypothetical protein
MGVGPSIAIPKALSQAGISKEDVDLFEVILPITVMRVWIDHIR